ncbi:His-Xaa-Ser system radical SAM maturase HxsC [Niveibacterium sp. SC-1]|uniref:His-Xaa-Ser system radical SAM maturase HxsC n=1 Tax=Niveibacterium sp. SC-1 TaxID=3135646 RepID=UPI00311E1077
MKQQGLSNLWIGSSQIAFRPGRDEIGLAADADPLEAHDVVVLDGPSQTLRLAYRASHRHSALFLTNRCNSNCLMCSQPPTRHDDSWLVSEALAIVRHMSEPPRTLGLTGGEPTLLGPVLPRLLVQLRSELPSTQFEILSNGRALEDPKYVAELAEAGQGSVSWLVPLYGHADFLHDYVVQAPGAFEQTLMGLLNLRDCAQAIQLRIVLIEPVLSHLTELCGYIARNLRFVREVALMACEPIGFALANKAQCSVNLTDWHQTLADGVDALSGVGVRTVIMNAPRCALPRELWRFAARSISDWKQVYADKCGECVERESCSGLFAWHERGWTPAPIRPVLSKTI